MIGSKMKNKSTKRGTKMKINYGIFNEKLGTVVAWHEDMTQKGNYVLTLETETGQLIHAIERQLASDQIDQLKETVSKDDTGL